jgi:adenylate cyclase
MSIDQRHDQAPVQEVKKPKEIERKFLVATLPENLEQYPHKEIVQGYIAITPDGTEVRLRKKGEKYFQTIKSGLGKIRGEHEIEITEDQFNTLWPTTEGKRVEKVRYEIPVGENIIELDIYSGDLNGLLTAEVEFNSEEGSNSFEPPVWLGKEVTEDKRYKNQNLALHGALPEMVPKVEKVELQHSDIPRYELNEGISKLVESIREKISQKEGPIIVEVAGGSASGKTSAVAMKIKEYFGEDALIFSMDDYYRGKTYMDEQAQGGNVLNWDQPEALNLELLQKHLEQLKKGEAIEKPIYSMKTGEQDGVEEVQPKRIIIVEGLFALNDAIKGQGDVKAFVDIGTHGRILRRLLRDIERTGQRPADILKYFSQVVEPMHEKHIQNTLGNADLIVKNEYSPQVEAERSGLHEVQLKFKAEIDEDVLRKLGAERLGTATQVDYYYNPKDRNLIETDEILRIRNEGMHKVLTYKGPRVESEFRKRPKFEFEIDEETEKRFLSIYGDQIKTILKDRVLYQLDGIVFSIDSVSKIENVEKTQLGLFIEIRSTDKDASEEDIKKLIEKLGLSGVAGIKQSYFEM